MFYMALMGHVNNDACPTPPATVAAGVCHVTVQESKMQLSAEPKILTYAPGHMMLVTFWLLETFFPSFLASLSSFSLA